MTAGTTINTYLSEGTHAARPATPNLPANGLAFYYEIDTTNTFLYDLNTAAWVQVGGGGAAGSGLFSLVLNTPCKVANTGLSTQVNFTTATTNDGTQGQRIIAPNLAATSMEGMRKAVPGTPYTKTVLLSCNMNIVGAAQGGAGIGFESSTGKLETIMMYSPASDQKWHVYSSHWASPTNYTTTDADSLLGTGGLLWLQIDNDGVHAHYRYSFDGENWILHQTTNVAAGNMDDYTYVVWFALPQTTAVTTELLSYKDS